MLVNELQKHQEKIVAQAIIYAVQTPQLAG
jgi:hypothetical protein